VTATDRNFGMMYQTEADGISFPVANFGGNAINTTAENYVNGCKMDIKLVSAHQKIVNES
jgi:hypothetical protein